MLRLSLRSVVSLLLCFSVLAASAFEQYSYLPATGDVDGVSSIVTAGGNKIAFVYDRGMWLSDGTPEGTVKVVDYVYQETLVGMLSRVDIVAFSTGPEWKYYRADRGEVVTLLSMNKGPMDTYYGVPIGVSTWGVWAVWRVPHYYQFYSYDPWYNSFRNRSAIPDFPEPNSPEFTFYLGGLYTRYDVKPPGVTDDFNSMPSNLFGASSLSNLYFTWEQPGSGTGVELWRMQNIPNQPITYDLVADINPGPGNSNPQYFCEVPGNGLFFFANPTGSFALQSLFWSDGISGVRRLHDYTMEPFTSVPIARAGNRVVYIITLKGEGLHLWSSDGTVAGTFELMRINDNQLVSVGDFAFFVSSSDEFGLELYQTDGTAEGTFRVPYETVPGPGNSAPFGLTAIGTDLFFNAATPEGDIQVFKYTPERNPSNAFTIFDKEEEWVHPGGVQYTWGTAGTCEVDTMKSPTEYPLTTSSSTGSLEQHNVFRLTVASDFYGCGHFYPTFLDLSGAKEVRFWIKSSIAAKVELEVNAPCNPFWTTAGQNQCKPWLYVPSTEGQWKSMGIPLNDRPATEFAHVYSPFLMTAFGSGEVDIANIVAVY